jgi:hypothetical protein
MIGKWDALADQLERLHNIGVLSADDEGINPSKLWLEAAVALREAQAQLPPPGWRVTELTREDGTRAASQLGVSGWVAYRNYTMIRKNPTAPPSIYLTAAAAMAAIEEMK